MRITLDLYSFAHLSQAAYASLWLDTEMRRWSREGHELLELPKWGILELAPGVTLLCGETDNCPIVALEKLDLYSSVQLQRTGGRHSDAGPHEGASGRALMYLSDEEKKPPIGKWRILCVDHETIRAEHSNFADDIG
jgi:hypothetical protein